MIYGNRKTRYFLFSRVGPTDKDYFKLKKSCKEINAYCCYRLFYKGNKKYLKGVLVLRGHPTASDGSTLVTFFPNFLFHQLESDFELDFCSMPNGTVCIGNHPLDDVKKNLFGLNLRSFLSNV